MMVSISGTPGVGKTTVSKELERKGWKYLDLKKIIFESGSADDVMEGKEEILVDEQGLRIYLASLDFPEEENIVLDGHLSYLATSDICIVLRMEPKALKDRLNERDYSDGKVKENMEAEAVSVILVEAVELEEERLGNMDWKQLPSGCGIVFELDTTNISEKKVLHQIMDIIDAYRGKRLNELLEYRPGRIDWLEEMVDWF